ncbi:S8 family serine peptidase [Candidatus Roizmanbacteria bacterium]|nr:S8 family serine peptidase [Candidatus Roizmanbacteria bacterium]
MLAKLGVKHYLAVSAVVVILAAVPLTVQLATTTQNIQKSAKEPVGAIPIPQRKQLPPHVPGEVIVKLKQEVSQASLSALDIRTLPEVLQEVNDRHPIKSAEKIINKEEKVQDKLNRLKQNFSQQNNQRIIDDQLFTKSDLSKTTKLTFDPSVSVASIVEELKTDPRVEYAEPNYIVTTFYTPNDTFYTEQWPLENSGTITGSVADADIDASTAWNIQQGSNAVVIGVVDTGIDYTHPDLGGRIGSTYKVIGGYDFVNNDTDPKDDHGHGTHVAGTISAVTNNSRGVSGVCPNCKLMALKFLDSGGSGNVANAVRAIDYAVQNGADVLNNSWGGGGYSQTLQDSINQAAAAGVVFVAAAGNSNSSSPAYPASMEHVLSVAATDNADRKASFSNFDNGTGWVDIAAPGVSILSTFIPSKTLSLSCADSNHGSASDGFGLCSGTSMASPHVAGIAGLIFSRNPAWTSGQVLGQLKYTADSIDSKNPSFIGKLGIGRVNAYSALTKIGIPKLLYRSTTINDTSAQWPNGFFEPGETVRLRVGLLNEWMGATAVSAQLSAADPYVTISSGSSSYGTIAPGEIKYNATDYTVSLNNQAPPGYTISFVLIVTYTYNNKSYSQRIPFTYQASTDVGWPKKNGTGQSISFVDLDLNGTNEIITAGGYWVKAYTNDGHLLWTYAIAPEAYFTGEMAIGNIDTDPNPELVFGTRRVFVGPTSLYVLEHNGKNKSGWPRVEAGVIGFYHVLLAKANNDSIHDIIVNVRKGSSSTSITPSIRAYTSSNSLLWERTGPYDNLSGSSVGDVDGDGNLELVTSFYQYNAPWPSRILLTNIENGTDYGVSTIQTTDERVPSAPVLGDLDRNGDLEIVFSTEIRVPDGGNVYAYHHNGTKMSGWPKYTGTERLRTSPTLTDLDADKDLEIVINSQTNTTTGNLFAWHHTGTNVSGWPVYSPYAFYYSQQSPQALAIDIDTDSNIELLFAGYNYPITNLGDCFILAYNHNGVLVTGYPRQLGIEPCELFKFTAGTINSTTHLGIISHGNYDAFLHNTQDAPNQQLMQWPMFMHDLLRTGSYNGLITPTPLPVKPIPLPTSTPTRTPTPKPLSCTIMTNELQIAMSPSSTYTVTATVSSNGTVQKVTFASSNTGIVTLSPAEDTITPYNTRLTSGLTQGTTSIVVKGIVNGLALCSKTVPVTVSSTPNF